VIRKLLATLVTVTFAALLPSVALADIPTIQNTVVTSSTLATPWLPLSGQSACTVLITGATTITAVPQLTSDTPTNISNGSAVAVTATTIGTGSLTANGTYTGNIAGLALTGFRVNITAISGSTATVTYGCSGAVAGTTQSGGSVTLPFAGNASGVAAGANQSVGLVYYNGTTMDAVRGTAGSVSVQCTSGCSGSVADAPTALAAGVTTTTVIKNVARKLYSVLVTVAGSNALTCYDNASAASGTIILIVPAGSTAGSIVSAPGANGASGITCAGNASNPGVTFFTGT